MMSGGNRQEKRPEEGRPKADLLIRGGRLVNVMSGEIYASDVAVADGRILALHALEAEKEVDAAGALLLPGLIDAHVHIESSLCTPPAFARGVLPAGTTTVIADPHEIANVAGENGIRQMMAASRDIPLSVFFMIPSCVPAASFEDSGAVLGAEEVESLLREPQALGLGEVMDYPAVLNREPEMMRKIGAALQGRMPVDGHAPGLSGWDLEAYVRAGIGTDHESAEPEELREKLRLGQYALLREGSAARNLAGLLPAVDPGNSRRILFCTDDRQPEDILSEGHINHHLRMAVEGGVPPVEAVRMATLNAAEAYGLHDRGALVPGRRADIVIMEDWDSCWPSRVVAGGREVARDRRPLYTDKGTAGRAFSADILESVHIRALSKGDLAVGLPRGKARIIRLSPHSLTTGELRERIAVSKGGWETAQGEPLAKLAVVERHRASGKVGLGFLAGFGIRGGAVGSTIAHDSHNIIAVGTDDASLLAVIGELEKRQGGLAAASQGRILGSLSLPVGGLMTNLPLAEVDESLRQMEEIAYGRLGISRDYDPFMTPAFLALPVIPKLKLTARGLFDVERFEFVPLDTGEAAGGAAG